MENHSVFSHSNDVAEVKIVKHEPGDDESRKELASDDEFFMNCSLCKKDVLKKDIFGHTYQHMFAGRKMHPCHLCEKSFKEENLLRTHLTIHTGEKPHQCDQCDKSFRLPQSLKNHVNIHHTREDLATCDQCGETFTYKKGLVTHMSKVHGVDTGFKCTHCNERFLTEKGLKSHQDLNSCFKHCCTECGKVFKLKNSLNKHKETHMEKTYDHECNQCGKAFPSIYTLKRHEKLHLNLNEFKCFCGKSFNRKDGLQVHVKNHHLPQDEKKIPDSGDLKSENLLHDKMKNQVNGHIQDWGMRAPTSQYFPYGDMRHPATQHLYQRNMMESQPKDGEDSNSNSTNMW